MTPRTPNPTSLYSTPRLTAAAEDAAGGVLLLDKLGATLIVRVASAASVLTGDIEAVVDVVLAVDCDGPAARASEQILLDCETVAKGLR